MNTLMITKAKSITLVILLCINAGIAIAQDTEKEPRQEFREARFEQLKSMKVAYITRELNLTPAEAEKFWPLYNEFETKRNEIVSSIMQGPPEAPADFDRMSDEEVDEMITLKFKEERAMVDLQEQYFKKYKEVLPVKKIAKYYEAEKRFRSHLLHEIRDGKFREGREEYMKERGDR